MKGIKSYYLTNFGRKMEATPIVSPYILLKNEYIIEILVKHLDEVSPSFINLKRAFFFNVSEINLIYCPNIEKIYCTEVGSLYIGQFRPEIMGDVSHLSFQGGFVDFKNLMVNEIELHK